MSKGQTQVYKWFRIKEISFVSSNILLNSINLNMTVVNCRCLKKCICRKQLQIDQKNLNNCVSYVRLEKDFNKNEVKTMKLYFY